MDKKTYITEIGAVIWLLAQVALAMAVDCPVQKWIPWLTWAGGTLLKTAYGTMSLRAISKIVPKPEMPKL